MVLAIYGLGSNNFHLRFKREMRQVKNNISKQITVVKRGIRSSFIIVLYADESTLRLADS
jgi:hypothetical protein